LVIFNNLSENGASPILLKPIENSAKIFLKLVRFLFRFTISN